MRPIDAPPCRAQVGGRSHARVNPRTLHEGTEQAPFDGLFRPLQALTAPENAA